MPESNNSEFDEMFSSAPPIVGRSDRVTVVTVPWTAEDWAGKIGVEIEDDELERVNCQQAGEFGHWYCGICKFCSGPACRCLSWHSKGER